MMYEKMIEEYGKLYDKAIAADERDKARDILQEIERLEEIVASYRRR